LDLISHCKIRVGNGMSTSFWHDQWLGDSCPRLSYPCLFALENNKVCTVAAKMSAPFVWSLCRDVRGGKQSAQLSRIFDLLDRVVLSNMGDRRFWDLNGDGCFRVKDVRRMLDDMLLPKSDVPSRWVKHIPIKLQSSSKQVLEGVFYTSWWSIWSYRNHLLFSDSNPRKDGIF
nr:RNA-directed DNA polymerase, eukaryota [Tanacetum cinerariifolium]